MSIRPYLPAFLWALLILILCGMPGDRFPEEGFLLRIPFLDKAVHLFLFMILSFLLGIAFKKEIRSPFLKATAMLWAFLIPGLYGVLLEWLQYAFIQERSFESGDLIANWGGAAIGVLLFRGIYGKE